MKWLKLVIATLTLLEAILIVPLAVKVTSYLQQVLQSGRTGSVADMVPHRVVIALAVVSLIEFVLLFVMVKIRVLPRLIGVIAALLTTILACAAVAVLLMPRN